MTVMNLRVGTGLSAADELSRSMPGKVALPGEAAYARARQIWNGAVDHRPALFAFCETAEDVQSALQVARVHGLPLSVRGGGHDWAGRALRPDGLVLDLSGMRRVTIDSDAGVATVEGGATAADVIAAAAPYGLAAVTGTIGAVGMAGLTLGGGYGPLTARYGLALDNLLSAELVLADGSLVTADAATNPELFWALRGGGGNFGAVTAMRIRLHPLRELLAGLILYPWYEAEAVLQGYAAFAPSQPDDFAVSPGVISGPDGSPLLFLAPSWTGARSEGEEVMARLQGLGKPVWAEIAPMTCGEMLRLFDDRVVNGRCNAVETRWVSTLTPEVIRLLVAGGAAKPSPFAAIMLQHFRGAAARVPIDATAFGLRREHFLIVILAAWEAEAGDAAAADEAARHRQWAERLSLALALTPAAVPGGYPNLLGPHQQDRAALAYGYKIIRLQRAKQRFDPDGVFTSATPLPA